MNVGSYLVRCYIVCTVRSSGVNNSAGHGKSVKTLQLCMDVKIGACVCVCVSHWEMLFSFFWRMPRNHVLTTTAIVLYSLV